VLQVMRDIGIGQIELIAGVEAVPLFGDGERDDAGIARRQACKRGRGIGGSDKHFAYRADHTRPWRSAEFHQRVQPLLWRQGVTQRGAFQ
jgi:hypothetical protein